MGKIIKLNFNYQCQHKWKLSTGGTGTKE